MLTPSERDYAIERAISHIEGRFVERMILEAKDHAEAARVAREQCRWWGCSGPDDPYIRGEPGGIKITMPDGREGLVSYSEMVEHVRGLKQAYLF